MGRELDITAQYLDLMGFLYGEQVLYHMDLDPALSDMPTPKIWMQPILENFFKHNFRDDEKNQGRGNPDPAERVGRRY